ncbi:hypothetical protein BDZ91DRAFT_851317 [Kalaharituber pfeilii]|nr:hypothetical protein BDZ91DRAFT_851317 [Kalaharituber pfeilii]
MNRHSMLFLSLSLLALLGLHAVAQMPQVLPAIVDTAESPNIAEKDTSREDLDDAALARREAFDAQIQALDKLRTRQSCPVSCGARRCCRAGERCCYGTTCCVTSTLCCCPLTAETCGGLICVQSPAVCCGGGLWACPQGSICNPAGRGGRKCCLAGETPCPGGCCSPGYTCAPGRPGQCVRIVPTVERPTTSPRRTSTTSSTTSRRPSTTSTTSTPEPQQSEEPDQPDEPDIPEDTPMPSADDTPETTSTQATTTEAAPEPCETGTRKMKRDVSAPGGWVDFDVWKRQNGDNDDEDVGEFCRIGGKDIPVMTFRWFEDLTDDLVENMCRGIKKRGGGNEVVLTWAGDGRNRSRRRASGCRGFCRGKRSSTGERTSCDEFPFAATREGGTGAHIGCIVAWQNTMQGIYINSWSAFYGIKAGDQFVVRMEGVDCSRVSSSKLAIRQAGFDKILLDENGNPYPDQDGLIPISGDVQTSKYRQGIGPDVAQEGLGYYINTIGDVNPGFYSFLLTVQGSGPVEKVKIINGDGEEVEMLQSSYDNYRGNYTFRVSDIDYGLGAVVYSTDRNLHTIVTYNAQVRQENNSNDKMDTGSSGVTSRDSLFHWAGVLAMLAIQTFYFYVLM